MKALLKLVIAILLLLCLTDLPYGFYEITRFAACAAFAYLSYDYFKQRRDFWGIVFAALALLFQPFFKISLGRTLWNAVDIIVALSLFYLIIRAIGKKR